MSFHWAGTYESEINISLVFAILKERSILKSLTHPEILHQTLLDSFYSNKMSTGLVSYFIHSLQDRYKESVQEIDEHR